MASLVPQVSWYETAGAQATGQPLKVYFSVGVPAFMRGKERFSAPVEVRLRSAL